MGGLTLVSREVTQMLIQLLLQRDKEKISRGKVKRIMCCNKSSLIEGKVKNQ